MLNADWVQLNCRCKPEQIVRKQDGKEITETIVPRRVRYARDYRVEVQPFRTSLAQRVEYVYYKETKLAEVISEVDSSCIDSETIFVRFDNKFLYGERLFDRVCIFLEDNNLIFHNWTRFDVCCDFNKFFKPSGNFGAGARSYAPDKFIKDYLSGKYRLLNKRRGRKRKGCVWFEDGEKSIDFQSLRLGSKFSPVNVKLYNKTTELRDEKDKPYIREQWKLNNDINLSEDVWRLEFSIMDFNAIVIEDDELRLSLKKLEILKEENIALLWNLLREHYFVFYKEDGTKNVSRKKRVDLFGIEETGLKLRNVSQKEETTRAHKIFIKKLLETQQKIRENNRMKNVVWATDYVAAYLVAQHDLKDWTKSRFPEWKFENYEELPDVKVEAYQYTINFDGDRTHEKHRYSFGVLNPGGASSRRA